MIIEISDQALSQKEKNREFYKSALYDKSVTMYNSGFSIDTIINRCYDIFHDLEKSFTKSMIRGLVYQSIYHFVMQEKETAGD